MNPARPCPRCGKSTANGELADLCPACLLAQGLETDTGAARPSFEPPSIERIARLFPQLGSLRLLGAGGMGAVYQARQPTLDRCVALKVVPAATGPENAFQERFYREARALARLNHPNIVTVHEFGQVEDLHYFIMEFVDGTNLRQLEKAGRLSPREALQIIPQICDALQYAHDEGVVHRDIKPENLLIDRKGRVKIADFGLAKILDPSADAAAVRLTIEGQVMGTPHYMAPEQLERPLAVDHRADIYSLGVVLYEMLTGDLPLGKFAPPSRKVAMDVRLDEVVLRALENDPARRYQHVGEVKTRLQSITETSPPEGSTTAKKPVPEFHYFAGFPLRIESDGRRKLNRTGVAQALAMVFGVLTLASGLKSLFASGSTETLIGIGGLRSLSLRLAFAAAAVAWAARLAKPLPQDGLPPLGWRRRAALVSVALACAIALITIPRRRPYDPLRDSVSDPRLLESPDQMAMRSGSEGSWIALLPNGGVLELLAVKRRDSPESDWQDPDGNPIAGTQYQFDPLGIVASTDLTSEYDMIFRFVDLPSQTKGVELPTLVATLPAGGASSGCCVLKNGATLTNGWPYRMTFPQAAISATLRFELSLDRWHTIAIADASGQPVHDPIRTEINQPAALQSSARFLSVAEYQGSARAAVLQMGGQSQRQFSVVSIDKQSNAHWGKGEGVGAGVAPNLTTWTYTFPIPLSEVTEFQARVRKSYTVEFQNVVLPRAKARATAKRPEASGETTADIKRGAR